MVSLAPYALQEAYLGTGPSVWLDWGSARMVRVDGRMRIQRGCEGRAIKGEERVVRRDGKIQVIWRGE